METPDEFMGSNDQIHVVAVKGRRNKRMRLVCGGFEVTSSSSCGGGGGGEEFPAASSSVSGEISTEEEEDMANCLILLAQGDGHRRQRQALHDRTKTEFYVYECKTCNRRFNSFQALGGHRASHKKPKPPPPPPIVATATAMAVEEREEAEFNKMVPVAAAASVVTNFQIQKGGKVHECSICGLEFNSGQALGGHMRRHRATAAVTTAQQQNHHNSSGEIKRRNILELDLNLPAPEEDLRETKFQFTATPQTIVFAAPTLVDCHY
ncbi:zinc finger protein ZAT5-like [Cucurbita pepo subsp. pepo]|uniref:zinc finger protein ZAT5-like n=1 Tax=Cucurbita pepo subsp. pepo TaxID=3664 RepID=UPI000C9D6E26|nr:zinc finger protein ZAT5-like [Cucurbita pepo subsp. pepo]